MQNNSLLGGVPVLLWSCGARALSSKCPTSARGLARGLGALLLASLATWAAPATAQDAAPAGPTAPATSSAAPAPLPPARAEAKTSPKKTARDAAEEEAPEAEKPAASDVKAAGTAPAQDEVDVLSPPPVVALPDAPADNTQAPPAAMVPRPGMIQPAPSTAHGGLATPAAPRSAVLDPSARRTLEELRPFLQSSDLATRAKLLDRFRDSADPAVIAALRYIAIHDNQSSTAAAAVVLLGTQEQPEAIDTLSWLAMNLNRKLVWEAAIKALGERGAPAAGELLFTMASDEALSSSKRRLAVATLEANYPSLFARRAKPRVAGNWAIPTLGGAVFGGYTLFTVGEFALSDAGPTIGAVGGTLIGATTGFLLSQNLSNPRALFYTSAMGWGLTSGIIATRALDRFPSSRLLLSMGVVGELIGGGAAYLVADALDYSSEQVLFVDFNGMAGAMLGTGLGWLVNNRDERVTPALALAGALAGLGVAGFGAGHATLTTADGLLAGWAAVEGGWLGAWLTAFFTEADPWGAFWTGSTLAFFAGEAVSQFTDISARSVGQMATFSLFGKALGSGLAMMSFGIDGNTDPLIETVAATQLALGTVGLIGGALLANKLHYSSGDLALVPVATGLGLWHGLGIGAYLSDRDIISGQQLGGMALAVPALFGLGAIALSQYSDASAWQIAMSGMGSLWGAWFVAWSAALGNWEVGPAILATLIGSDLGLALVSILVSPLVNLDPMLIAGASLGALVLTGLSTLAAAMLTLNSNVLIATNIIASGVGLVGGGLLTAHLLRARDKGSDAKNGGGGAMPSLPAFALSFEPVFSATGEVDGGMLVASF